MSSFFEGYIINEIYDQIKQYGYCFFEFKKTKNKWSLNFSGSEYPYRVTSDYYEELESIVSEDEIDVDNSKRILKTIFSRLEKMVILENSIRVSKARISCILCKKETIFHKINSIESLIQSVSEIRKSNIGLNLYYRGELAKWNPIPSLFRNRKYVINEVVNDEKVISLVPDEFINCKTDFEKLVKLKHYSEPSRLLDLSKSPLVALFFALECMKNNKNEIGIIRICFSKPEKEKVASISDTVSLITGIAKTSLKKCEQYQQKEVDCSNCSKNDSECQYFSELKNRVKRITSVEYDWETTNIRESVDTCIIVHPPYNNYRIIQQQGLFVFCGRNNYNIYSCPEKIVRIWRNPDNRKNEYFYITPDMFQTLENELEALGINKYYIYGSLDNEIESIVKDK